MWPEKKEEAIETEKNNREREICAVQRDRKEIYITREQKNT